MQQPQQQQPTVTVYGGGAAPGSVIVQTVAPVVYRPQQPHTRPAVLPHKKLHMVFGAIQILVGGLCFLLGVIACSLSTDYQRFGAGIYSGIFFFIPGLLGYLAGRYNSTCCVIGCMVMNIIATCVSVIGMSFASIELAMYYRSHDYADFIRGKSVFVLCACIFEFVFTIIHSSLTCASCCYCCMPRTNVAEPGQVATTAVQGVPVQQHTYYPTQQPYVQQHYPQQMAPQPAPVGFAPYPGQPAMQAHLPQNAEAMPPYNPAFGHDSAYPAAPPSYSEAMQNKPGGL